jgi:hypothetical protein
LLTALLCMYQNVSKIHRFFNMAMKIYTDVALIIR